MGQYWYPVNLDRKEFIHPCKLDTGLKLWEQIGSPVGSALIILCAAERAERGGGDLPINEHTKDIIGRWAGNRIALVGDYAKDTDLPEEFRASQIYSECRNGGYKDISERVVEVLGRVG